MWTSLSVLRVESLLWLIEPCQALTTQTVSSSARRKAAGTERAGRRWRDQTWESSSATTESHLIIREKHERRGRESTNIHLNGCVLLCHICKSLKELMLLEFLLTLKHYDYNNLPDICWEKKHLLLISKQFRPKHWFTLKQNSLKQICKINTEAFIAQHLWICTNNFLNNKPFFHIMLSHPKLYNPAGAASTI